MRKMLKVNENWQNENAESNVTPKSGFRFWLSIFSTFPHALYHNETPSSLKWTATVLTQDLSSLENTGQHFILIIPGKLIKCLPLTSREDQGGVRGPAAISGTCQS